MTRCDEKKKEESKEEKKGTTISCWNHPVLATPPVGMVRKASKVSPIVVVDDVTQTRTGVSLWTGAQAGSNI